jgi:5-methylcytosine-specific restriction protein A
MSDKHEKIERQKARELRKSRWWQNQIAQNAKCYYCQKDLSKAECTMDHIVPIAQGGKSTKGNCVICCKDCNTKKKSCTPIEWQDYLEISK